MADGDPVKEKELRKMDIFSFLNRILALSKKAKSESSSLESEPFGK
jgi:hypothetical protein